MRLSDTHRNSGTSLRHSFSHRNSRNSGSYQISCQDLREELREELRRFAAETLAHRLTELGKRMRQGVQEDLHSLLMSAPHFASAESPWAGESSTLDAKAAALGSMHAEQLAQTVSQLMEHSPDANGYPAPSDSMRHRDSVASNFSSFSAADGTEDHDPDQLGWLSRCRRGFRFTKTMSYEQKKKRIRNSQRRRSSIKNWASEVLNNKERRDDSKGGFEGAEVAATLNGCLNEEATAKSEWSINSPALPSSPPPERTASDIIPIKGIDISDWTAKPETSLPIVLPKVQPVPSTSDNTLTSTKCQPEYISEPASSSASLSIMRHPKTYIAGKEIGPLLQGKHHMENKEENKEGTEVYESGESSERVGMGHRKSAKQIWDEATKAKRVSHGGPRALLKAAEDMGVPMGHSDSSFQEAHSAGGLEHLIGSATGTQLRRSASFQTDSSAHSHHSQMSSIGGSSFSSARAVVKDKVQKVKSCFAMFRYILCFPFLVLIRIPAAELVESYTFDYASAILIGMNAICIGIETDWMARNLEEDPPVYFMTIDSCFCCFFLFELTMRVYVYRCSFFTMAGYRWNIFDFLLVCMQVFEEVMEMMAVGMSDAAESHTDMTSNFSIMRILRVLRLVRIIRLVRVMHLVSELRTIVVAIFGTLQSLLWTMALLLLVMYIMSVYLTQMVTAVLIGDPEEHVVEDLRVYYGNLALCILSLFQAITNGVDWKIMLDPLTEHVNPALALLFCFYVGFSLFALMNIVTGVFVESALQTAKNDKDMFLLHHMTHLFMKTDVDDSGEISWDEFQNQLDTADMQEYFKAVDLDTEEARDLFRLIDVDSSGQIDAEEFVHGCLRLRGPAKAIDLATFMHDYRRTTRRWYRHSQSVERCLSQISACLPELARASSSTLRMVTNNAEPSLAPRRKGLTSL